MEQAANKLEASTEAQEGHGDKRRHPRSAFAGTILRMDGPEQECGGLDITPSGVGMLSAEPMSVGQEVRLAFLSRCVSVKGVVRHVRPYKSGDWIIGIAFERSEPELTHVLLAAS